MAVFYKYQYTNKRKNIHPWCDNDYIWFYRCQWRGCYHQWCEQWRWWRQWWGDGGELEEAGEIGFWREDSCKGKWCPWTVIPESSPRIDWVKVDAVYASQMNCWLLLWLRRLGTLQLNAIKASCWVSAKNVRFWWQTLLNSVIETTPHYVPTGPTNIWISF